MPFGALKSDIKVGSKLFIIDLIRVIEERRKRSNIHQAAYKNAAERCYNKRVKEKAFKMGDYVMTKNEVSHAQPRGKVGPTWEGQNKLTEAH